MLQHIMVMEGEIVEEVTEIKDLLLEILTDAFKTPDIQATQQMGVSMTSAAMKQREGVTIIQNQSVEVLTRIMPPLVKALKLCDALDKKLGTAIPVKAEPPLQLPPPEPPKRPDIAPMELFCEWMFDKHTTWKLFQKETNKAYMDYVISKFDTKAKAAKWLGIGTTYLSKLSSPQESKRKRKKESEPLKEAGNE